MATNDAAKQYRRVPIALLIKKGSDLEKRIQEYAEDEEMTFSAAVDFIAHMGIYHHMMGNLDLLLRSTKNT